MRSFYLCLCILCSGKKAIHDSKIEFRFTLSPITFQVRHQSECYQVWRPWDLTWYIAYMLASWLHPLDTAALKYEIGLVKFNSRSSVTGPAQIPGRAHLESRNGIAWVWVCSINGNDQNRMAWYSIQGWTRSRAYIGIPSTQSDLAGGCLALDMRRRISEASFWMNEAKLCVIHMCTVYDINIIYI